MSQEVMSNIRQLIKEYRTIIFDFDGVIKDSVHIKNSAYLNLFSKCELSVTKNIKKHLAKNSGMSRYLKIPIYLQWSGIEASQENVDIYIKKYSSLVVGAVIQSSWVLGVQEFIKDNFNNFDFYIISATPEDEMNLIATEIGISSFFQGIYGSPAKKNELISRVIELNKINPKDAIFIGDTSSDLEAAISSNIKFILICNECNRNFQDNYKGEKINNFL